MRPINQSPSRIGIYQNDKLINVDVEPEFMTLQDQESGFNTNMCYEEIMMIQFGSHVCPNMGIAHRIFPDFGAQRIVDLHYPVLLDCICRRCLVLHAVEWVWEPISQSTLLTSFTVVYTGFTLRNYAKTLLYNNTCHPIYIVSTNKTVHHLI